MTVSRDSIIVAIGAVIAVLLQVIVAPNVPLFSAKPNIMLAYVVTVAACRPHKTVIVLPFVMGMIYDLLGSGPVGVMGLLFLLASIVISRLFTVFDNETPITSVAMVAIGCIAVEILYGIVQVLLGMPVGILAAIGYRSIPCGLYDCLFGLLMYPLLFRLLKNSVKRLDPNITQLR